jgi:predicted glycoside hydrolase/deacetylase ChbG (UPF0249 family)
VVTLRLVVNADGFGHSEAEDQGILRAHRDGILRSTNVLGNVGDPAATLRPLLDLPRLGVGVQLNLVTGSPVAGAARVPSLLNEAGAFPSTPKDVVLAWAKARLRAEELQAEFDAQVTRLRDHGLSPDHLCVRHHLGFLPAVALAAENVARRHRLEGLRVSVEMPTLAWFTEVPKGLRIAAIASLSWFARRRLGALRHGPQSWGYFESGHLDEIRVLEIIGRLQPGHHELICHPRFDEEPPTPRGDLFALTSPRVAAAIANRGIEVCRWRDLF